MASASETSRGSFSLGRSRDAVVHSSNGIEMPLVSKDSLSKLVGGESRGGSSSRSSRTAPNAAPKAKSEGASAPWCADPPRAFAGEQPPLHQNHPLLPCLNI